MGLATTGAVYEDRAADEKAAVGAIKSVAAEALHADVAITEAHSAESAGTSLAADISVEFPVSQDGVVSMTAADGATLSMGLPQGTEASEAEVLEGAAVYDNGDGSHTISSLGSEG